MDQEHVRWFKSSHSGGSGTECVQVALTPGRMGVRDSKRPQGPRLAFTADTWSGFIQAVQDGDL
ncbi:DUF397 domain-containing protein [Streptomyces sp. NPDC002402]